MNYDVKNTKILFNEDGSSKGSAFVTMNSQDDVMNAIQECRQSPLELDGNRLFVQISRQ